MVTPPPLATEDDIDKEKKVEEDKRGSRGL
jgi:hypothetical protein